MVVIRCLILIIISFLVTIADVEAVSTHQITWDAGFDCATWASNQTFTVGDTLIFYSNNAFKQDKVMNVSHSDYRICNPSSPYATYQTGNNQVTIDQMDLYFISSVQGDCRTGLQLHVHALPASTTPHHRASSTVASSSSMLSYMSIVCVLYLLIG